MGFIDQRPLALTIYYFPEAQMEGDIDNIVKPIMDALTYVAYLDDRHVERVVAQKFEAEVARDFVTPSSQIIAVLNARLPVVYIRVDDNLRWRRLNEFACSTLARR